MHDVDEGNMQLHQELSACLKSFTEQPEPIYRDPLLATDFEGETMLSLALSKE
jgi:RNA polymerase sigma-70 factor, ECF subfamily